MTKIIFHVYIAGTTSYSKQILQLYQEACSKCIQQATYTIEVIDVLKTPELAEKYKVLATPTISRTAPVPEKRIIGKLNSEQAIKAVQFLTEDIITL